MTARAIDDPGSLGWEYDSATGRWTWGGSSSGGGGGGTGGGIPEAPVNGKQYGRQDAGWTEVVSGGGGGGESYDDTQIKADLEQETQDRIDGDTNLQNQINSLSGGGGGNDPRITNQQISNWDTSFGWGDHGDVDYMRWSEFTETDPTVPSYVKNISQADIDKWNANTGGGGGAVEEAPEDGHKYARKDGGWSKLEPGDGGGGGGTVGEDPRITDTQIEHWDLAYSWGDHAEEGYATEEWVTNKQYATEAWVTNKSYATEAWVTNKGYATQTWVTQQGYATETWVGQNYQPKGSYLTSSDLSSYATTSWVSSNYQPKGSYLTSSDLTPYATTVWVDSAYQPRGDYAASNHTHNGYAASNHTHSGYAASDHTHTGYLTSSDLTPYATTVWVDTAYMPRGLAVPNNANSTISGTLTATDFIASSDKSKKKSIVTAPLGTVEQLRGVEFEWKDSGEMSSGVIAQEVEKVLPHLVHKDDKGDLAVSYMGLIGYLIEEVKDLRREIEEMK